MSQKIEYKYNSIYPTQVIINEPQVEDVAKYFNNSQLNITVNTSTIRENENIFLIDLTVLFHPEEFEEPFFSIRLRNKFTIENADTKKITNFEDEDDVLYRLYLTLVSISYSTTRGYLVALLSNYRYKDLAFLPVIDPKILVSNFDKEEKE